VWIVILLAHLRFRRSIGAKINELPLKLRLFPLSNILGILILVALGFSTFYVEGLQYSVPIFAVLLVIMSGMYWNMRRNQKFVEAAEVEMAPANSPAEP
jgi:L-asparagine transporter-like permease